MRDFFYNLFKLGGTNSERVSLIRPSNPQEVALELEAINHRLEADEEKAIIRLSQKQNCRYFLFSALCAGGVFVGMGFLAATIRYYKSLAAQETDNFFNLPINNSTCHNLYPEINELEDCCYWSDHLDCLWNFISFCSNIVHAYCDYKGSARGRTFGAVFMSLFGGAVVCVSGGFLHCVLNKERSIYIDLDDVANETLTCRERIFLMFQGILYTNTRTSNVQAQSTYRQIVLTLGTDRKDLYTLFGTHIKDYCAEAKNDFNYTPDAYNLCSQFPVNN